jgi:hypothetical protein
MAIGSGIEVSVVEVTGKVFLYLSCMVALGLLMTI